MLLVMEISTLLIVIFWFTWCNFHIVLEQKAFIYYYYFLLLENRKTNKDWAKKTTLRPVAAAATISAAAAVAADIAVWRAERTYHKHYYSIKKREKNNKPARLETCRVSSPCCAAIVADTAAAAIALSTSWMDLININVVIESKKSKKKEKNVPAARDVSCLEPVLLAPCRRCCCCRRFCCCCPRCCCCWHHRLTCWTDIT
jgi:hypothetical protein